MSLGCTYELLKMKSILKNCLNSQSRGVQAQCNSGKETSVDLQLGIFKPKKNKIPLRHIQQNSFDISVLLQEATAN